MRIYIMEEYIDFDGLDTRKTNKFIEIPDELIKKIDKLHKTLTGRVAHTITDTTKTD